MKKFILLVSSVTVIAASVVTSLFQSYEYEELQVEVAACTVNLADSCEKKIVQYRFPAGFDEHRIQQNLFRSASHQDRRKGKLKTL